MSLRTSEPLVQVHVNTYTMMKPIQMFTYVSLFGGQNSGSPSATLANFLVSGAPNPKPGIDQHHATPA